MMNIYRAITLCFLFQTLLYLSVFVSGHFVFFIFIPLFYLLNQYEGRWFRVLSVINGLASGLTLLYWVYGYNEWYFIIAYSLWIVFFISYVAIFKLIEKYTFLPNWFSHGFSWLAVGYTFEALTLGGYWNEVSIFFPMTSFFVQSVGGKGVTFALLTLQSLFVDYLLKKKRRYLISSMLVLALFISGHLVANLYNYHPVKSLKVALIQGSFQQTWKWRQENIGIILSSYKKLSEEASLYEPDLIVWPEYSIPVDFISNQEVIRQELTLLAKELRTKLLLGTIKSTFVDETHFDVATVISNKGLVDIYESVSPIYMNQNTIPSKKPVTPLKTIYDAAILICYEELFPSIASQYSLGGAKYIISLSNNQGFGYGRDLILKYSQLRAAETFKSLVRVSNTGKSVIINPFGYIEAALPVDESGLMVAYVDLNSVKTPYARFGDIPIFVLMLLVVSLKYRIWFISRKTRSQED